MRPINTILKWNAVFSVKTYQKHTRAILFDASYIHVQYPNLQLKLRFVHILGDLVFILGSSIFIQPIPLVLCLSSTDDLPTTP